MCYVSFLGQARQGRVLKNLPGLFSFFPHQSTRVAWGSLYPAFQRSDVPGPILDRFQDGFMIVFPDSIC